MEGYKFLESTELPCLVLAIVQYPNYLEVFNFKPRRQWLHLQHQTAGNACHQVFLDATILEPRHYEKINALAKDYDDSCLNMWGLTIDTIIEYRERLNELLGVDCNMTFSMLEEGIYPIDATTENIKKLCKDRLPKDLDNLIDWSGNEIGKLAGCIGRWHLFILGENCD